MSASEALWQRCPSALRGGEINFIRIEPCRLAAEDDLLLWAARALYRGYTHKLLAELCNRETSDSLARLLTSALLVQAYGVPKFSECWLAIPTIARELSLSRSSVKRALDELEKLGLLSRDARWRENGGRSSNLYLLTEKGGSSRQGRSPP